MNKTTTQAPDTCEAGHPLLSYEDIYHAAGILNPPSGYGIQKVVDMLNSDRIRDLSNDIKRVSVLMALDAAGASADDVLQDATRRQQALDAYEAGQRRQLEELEARKAQENSQIEAELERLKVHYAERVQRNRDQVEQQKAILRNWKMAMQHEGQRISDVIDLCRKPSDIRGHSIGSRSSDLFLAAYWNLGQRKLIGSQMGNRKGIYLARRHATSSRVHGSSSMRLICTTACSWVVS